MHEKLLQEIKKFGLLSDSLEQWQLQDICKAVSNYIIDNYLTNWYKFEDGNLPPHGRLVLFYFPCHNTYHTGVCFHDEIDNLRFVPKAFSKPSHWMFLPIQP